MRALRHAFALVLTASMLIVPIGAANADDGDGSTVTAETTTAPEPSNTTSTDDSTDSTPPADPPAEEADPPAPPAEDEGTTDDETKDSTPPADEPKGDGSSDEGTDSTPPAGDSEDDGTTDQGTTDESTDDQVEAVVPQVFSAQSSGISIMSTSCGQDACNDSYTTTERTLLTGNVFDNDEPSFRMLFGFTIQTDVSKGTLMQTAFGGFTYAPDLNATGTDTFTYTYDTGGIFSSHISNIATVTINITGAPPQTANDDTYYVEAGSTLTLDYPGVFANDDSQLHIGFDVEDGVDHGDFDQFASLFGGFKYTPDAGFTGTDAFTYHYYHLPTLSASSTATVNIVVYEEPTLNYDDYITDMGVPLTVGAADGVLANDTGGPINSLEVVNTNDGTVNELNADGSFTFTPDPGFYGYARFIYRATYGDNLVSDDAEVWIWVNDTRLPTIVDDTYTINQGETLNVPAPGPMGNDIFPSDTEWEIANCTQPPHATVTCAPDGTLTVVPEDGFSGPLTFTYEVEKKPLASFAAAVAPAATHVGTVGSVTVNVAAPAPIVDDEPDDTALLPDTGAPVSPWLLAIAAGMITAGAGLVLRPRRRS